MAKKKDTLKNEVYVKLTKYLWKNKLFVGRYNKNEFLENFFFRKNSQIYFWEPEFIFYNQKFSHLKNEKLIKNHKFKPIFFLIFDTKFDF